MESEVICFCKGVTLEDIKRIVFLGAETVEDAENMLGCGTVCGECRSRVQGAIDYFIQEL